MIDDLTGRLGGLDVSVDNGGTGDDAPLLEMTLDQWRQTGASWPADGGMLQLDPRDGSYLTSDDRREG